MWFFFCIHLSYLYTYLVVKNKNKNLFLSFLEKRIFLDQFFVSELNDAGCAVYLDRRWHSSVPDHGDLASHS